MTEFWKKPPMKGKTKAEEDGNLPTFFTNYRPAGRRETANDVTGGDVGARAQNRYGKGDKPEYGGMFGRLMGPFFS